MFIKWMCRQNVIDPYHWILFSNKKEWTTDICFMNELQKHHSKYKHPDIRYYILYDSIYIAHPEKATL